MQATALHAAEHVAGWRASSSARDERREGCRPPACCGTPHREGQQALAARAACGWTMWTPKDKRMACSYKRAELLTQHEGQQRPAQKKRDWRVQNGGPAGLSRERGEASLLLPALKAVSVVGCYRAGGEVGQGLCSCVGQRGYYTG